MPQVDILPVPPPVPQPQAEQPPVQPPVQPLPPPHHYTGGFNKTERAIGVWVQRENINLQQGLVLPEVLDPNWILGVALRGERCTVCNKHFTRSHRSPCGDCGQCKRCHRIVTLTKEEELKKQVKQLWERIHHQHNTVLQLRQKLDKVQIVPHNHAALNASVIETDDPDKSCKICMSNESNTLLVPCCHKVTCYDCYKGLTTKKCPVCRKPIKQILPVYSA